MKADNSLKSEREAKDLQLVYEAHKLYVETFLALKTIAATARPKEELDLPPLSFRVLDFIVDHPGVSQREMVATFPLDKGLAARIINDLVKRNLVIRVEDPCDRRSRLLKLTPKGQKLAKILRQNEVNVAAQIFADFTQQELVNLKDAMLKLQSTLNV